ncbi:MAG TPA: putative Ig domain-containing protein [Baekduia sp.]|uniref:putative Ig domain-containing protein n=1 Tax=Baekduia sp. TaxID=2600305 RepID=UPI002D76F955|nr:putative Ig domain-containing protein [Baekduia sp.]HET6507874.1 putative Ig domain-containing protein [Baekduia sp.]
MSESGALPSGLTFDAITGTLSGTPRIAGTWGFSVTATNGAGPDATVPVAITVAPPLSGGDGPGAEPAGGELSAPGGGTPAGRTASVSLGAPTTSGTTARLVLVCTAPVGDSCPISATFTAVETIQDGQVIGIAARHKRTRKTVTLGTARMTVQAHVSPPRHAPSECPRRRAAWRARSCRPSAPLGCA